MTKNNGKQKRKNRRDINKDNLTSIERRILGTLREHDEPMTVKELATRLLGLDVEAEASGRESVRTIRNALRVPKAMGLLKHANCKGTYTVTNDYKKFGLKAAFATAAAWKAGREERRAHSQLEG